VKTYLVFEPAGGDRTGETADAVRFVREKFYWTALIVAPLWLIWHRLWLGLGGWMLAMTLAAGLVYGFGLDSAGEALIYTLPSLLTAFEGAELRRRKLLREGYRDAGTVIGADLADAERRFFADWATRTNEPTAPGAPAAPASRPAPVSAPNSVIGLFPEPGGGR
jgi:hypothetical protein